MEIKILGVGGFANSGLPFNSYLIEGSVLVETPPDILQSLKREGISLDSLDAVVLSHVHGDHCFGLPFLAFNLYLRRSPMDLPPPRLIAPPGASEVARSLLGRAISPDHPYVDWFFSGQEPAAMRHGSVQPCLSGLFLEFFRTEHSPETYSILAKEDGAGEASFISSSDTKWASRMGELFSRKAEILLCDGNGKGFGGVHLSPEEIRAFVKPLLKEGTRLLVTHITDYPEYEGESGDLEYARPGMVLRTKGPTLPRLPMTGS